MINAMFRTFTYKIMNNEERPKQTYVLIIIMFLVF